ncbi:mandelate racemase/muconate lactonizing enzyme family protein [Rhizobium sp. SSA_523]|uniref:mandelate racemase/muconate lactonizing enzyme family protein n=1 Tax=Rhizobium sp. SSA_523 TaxID=2952477 RepID=UPI0020912EEE|nr:mandelate racemase/muconate lactonizing enzyme family protein [Rhizobium sp. SSA_523]MCO5732198.1 mandelate racemase/muconate lactonizing enzyme family protein [Rhizobium sp. SSA_523]WKC21388.1 mandelate racemase/muconate lactonizing enzyme family protein [Rhizobium sp. SSA_523]
MHDRIASVDVFLFERPRETAYLGKPGADETLIANRYVVRGFNGTVYPLVDRSIVVRLRDRQGVEGWGETYGLIAPHATASIINDLLGPYLISLPPKDPAATWDALYALQRNRGYWGGYLADALAALDIALWDLSARAAGKSLQSALGRPGAGELPAYVSGLPAPTQPERIDMALRWKEDGFGRVKIPISHTDGGDVPGEVAALRKALGDDHEIAVDMHWAYTAESAIALGAALEQSRPWFLEAPVAPEDVDAQAAVAAAIAMPLALGEEWRTDWDYRPRLARQACSIVQPEMGHTGITQFLRIAALAKAAGAQIIPHATIGLGIFMGASLRAGLYAGAACHEFQHTIYHRNAELLEGAAACATGVFAVPDTAGIGVVPNDDAFAFLTKIDD